MFKGHLFIEVLLLVVILFLLSQKSYKPPKRPLTNKVCCSFTLCVCTFLVCYILIYVFNFLVNIGMLVSFLELYKACGRLWCENNTVGIYYIVSGIFSFPNKMTLFAYFIKMLAGFASNFLHLCIMSVGNWWTMWWMGSTTPYSFS
jgi:hypothetical protein